MAILGNHRRFSLLLTASLLGVVSTFGWLRARTGGIGAPALFHVLCNVLASTLTRGYGMSN